MGRTVENPTSWGTDFAGHEIAFISGPHDTQGMSTAEVLGIAIEIEQSSRGLNGNVAGAMERRAEELLNLAAQQEIAQQGAI